LCVSKEAHDHGRRQRSKNDGKIARAIFLTVADGAGKNAGMRTIKTVSVSILVLAAMSFAPAYARQPHMQAALAHLREARASLQRATPNKGGHRERAIELVNQAIAQVEAGERYAR